LKLAGCGCPPQRDDLLAEMPFLAAAGHTCPAFVLAKTLYWEAQPFQDILDWICFR
jgi:hypothetical protein